MSPNPVATPIEPTAVVQAPQPARMTYTQILLEAPGRVRKAELDAFEARVGLDRLVLNLKLHEASIAGKVAAAVGADGKKVHSNADARDAAVRELMAQDLGAVDLRRSIDEARATIAKVDAYATYWRDLQRSVRVLLLARSPFDAVVAVEDLA